MKSFLVCKVEIFQVIVNKVEVLSSLRWISDDFWLEWPTKLKRVPWFLADVNKDG